MQHSVLADRVSFRIGEKWKCIASGLAEFLGVGGGIHADRHHFNAALVKLVQVLLEAPQLGVAERSPVAAIEDQHKSAMIVQKTGGQDLLSCGIHEHELRCFLTDAQSGGRRWDLLCEVGHARNEESE